MMNKKFSWFLVVFWLLTLILLFVGKDMLAMYFMVIGMLAESLFGALHK